MVLALGAAFFSAACGAVAPEVPVFDPAHSPEDALVGGAVFLEEIATPTAAPTPMRTPPPRPDDVIVWWAAPVRPEDDTPAARVLRDQVLTYEARQAEKITIRTKRAEGVGGIFETLRTAHLVAPSVVPDLALVQHSELAKAAAAGLVQVIDLERLPFNDLFLSGLVLGQVGSAQVGIPYTLDVEHAVYRSAVLPSPPRVLDDLLDSGQPYLFPARAARGISPTFLAQYMAAGGRIADGDGEPVLDREPLVRVLSFYEKAVQAGVASPALLDYSEPMQYWSQFMTGKANIVQVDSTTYLTQRAGGMPVTGPSAVGIAPIPAYLETPLVIVDGWVWVITATSPDRRARALSLIEWFMDAKRQAEFTQALGVLPSRRAALATWSDDEDYAAFAESLLEQPPLPLLEDVNATVAAALQEAFEDVLRGRRSAGGAAENAITRVENIQ